MNVQQPSKLPPGALAFLWISANVVAMVIAFNVVFALLWQPYLNPIQYAFNLLVWIPLAGGLLFAATQAGVLMAMRSIIRLPLWFLLTLSGIFLMPLVESLITSGLVVDPISGLFAPDGFSGVARIAVAFLFTGSLPFSILLSTFAGLFAGAGNGLVLGGFQALALRQRRTALRWLVGTVIGFAFATAINSALYAWWIFTFQTENFPYLPLLTILLGLLYAGMTWGVLRGLLSHR
ncbi:MAG TPA: hypothetical protein VLH85_03845 [Levilinea sp.]|nr:hypothetical protein [Levilinea sp.]